MSRSRSTRPRPAKRLSRQSERLDSATRDAPPTASPPRRHVALATRATAALGYTTLCLYSSAVLPAGPVTGYGIAAGVVLAAFGGTMWLAYRWMRPRLGRATTFAALGLILALAFAALAFAAPNCPGGFDPGRCTSAEVATWTLVGALLPGLAVTFGVLPWLTWRAARRAAGWLHARSRRSAAGRR